MDRIKYREPLRKKLAIFIKLDDFDKTIAYRKLLFEIKIRKIMFYILSIITIILAVYKCF